MILTFDLYNVNNGMVTVKEYGYCPGNSVTDNPDEIYRIIKLSNALPFEAGDKEGYNYSLEISKQYTQDCTEKIFLERIDELKETASIVKSKDELSGAKDGNYLTIVSEEDLGCPIDELPFPEVFESDSEDSKKNSRGYIGTITEVLEKTVFIPDAISLEDADRKLREAYKNEGVVLTNDDCCHTEIVCREASDTDLKDFETVSTIRKELDPKKGSMPCMGHY